MLSLPVMEHFYTLQGEGYHQGKACYFIRLAGCDIGCIWCDVKKSWDKNNSTNFSPSKIAETVIKSGATHVVITGGEPTMYNLNPLCNELKKHKIKIHLETSGAYPILGQFDWICLSPKKFKFPLKENLGLAHEFKAVIYHKSDLSWIQQFLIELNPNCYLFLQPEWGKRKISTPLLVNYIKKHPEWQLSLQNHKYINIP